MNSLLKCLPIVFVLTCCFQPAVAEQADAIRVESEVIATGRAAVTRYADQELAALGFLDVTKAPRSKM